MRAWSTGFSICAGVDMPDVPPESDYDVNTAPEAEEEDTDD